ncbi:ribosome maturation factor RimM [Mesorhizobium sp. LHD-90]|uniref:ribosome maturation factor RimM n=1 Tax=Mesorhizobium sp. LHD-90 TaxID=3071414 RepID=UPI0027E02AFB|nr:ribosome maturation factor RimM [Mesorhizobium sp. LHD-90]MDQ6437091.1 ribosome maturation factor RimM [Mesorhizobium sp. LHD-90]
MAVIGAAHGIRGEVRVKTFTGDPLALGDYGPLHAADGRSFKILDIRPAGNVVVVRFKGIADRNAAEALNGVELFVDRSALPDDGEDGEFYHADLVGLAVRDENDAMLGRITAIQNFGGGDILEVDLAGSKDLLIPFTHAAVPVVDVAAGFVRIDSIAAGLVDDGEEGPAPEGQAGQGRRGFDAARRPRGPKGAGGNR